MKIVKGIVLVASLTCISMALFGSATAMAESTALCKADESPCGSPVTHVHYVAKKLIILTSAMDYECDALFLADVGKLGAPQTLEGQFTYTNCNQGCERKEENGPAVLSFLKTGHESAEVIGEGQIHSLCGSLIDCVYSFENLTGSAKGPLLSTETNGEITYVKQALTHVSGLFCPEEAYLSAKFVPLSATYISS